eukprot:11840606-Karenia_brevis.AAC.1
MSSTTMMGTPHSIRSRTVEEQSIPDSQQDEDVQRMDSRSIRYETLQYPANTAAEPGALDQRSPPFLISSSDEEIMGM